jgi:hypothetical protein
LPTRRFEGRSLEDALARASSEVGSEARVVGAERVRSGGLGGFFAREKVEIEVEVDDAVAPERADVPATLLDLADRISSEERREVDATIGTDRARPGGGRRTRVRPDAVTTSPPIPMPEQPAPDVIEITPPPQVTQTGPTPAPQVIQIGPPAPRLHPAATPHVSTETSTFAEILERITAETAPAPDRGDPVLVGAGTPDDGAAAPSTARSAHGDAAPLAPLAPRPVPGAAPARAPVQLIVRAAPPAPLTFPRPADDGGPLARLGLPPELEPTGDDLRDALVAQLASLPQPPSLPSSRGTVIAVVGPPGLAYQTARTIRGRVGTDAPIATFSPRAPDDGAVDEVSDQRRAWRRRPAPTVAVVDAPVGRPTDWAADALCALEPTAVWGIVDASRKVEDIAAWSTGLGGVDALCLSGLDETVSPAAALRTGLPVALLEGQPATAERWADLLLSRLSPEKELACSDS